MNKLEKIEYLHKILRTDDGTYADSFKFDITIFFDEFELSNTLFDFLDNLNTDKEIEDWVNKLMNRIVMHEDDDSIGEIIWDYWELG